MGACIRSELRLALMFIVHLFCCFSCMYSFLTVDAQTPTWTQVSSEGTMADEPGEIYSRSFRCADYISKVVFCAYRGSLGIYLVRFDPTWDSFKKYPLYPHMTDSEGYGVIPFGTSLRLEIVSEITDEVANTDLSSLELSDLQSKLQNCQKVCGNFSPNVNGGQVGI